MKPIDALMFALVERFSPEFVPDTMRGDFEEGVGKARQTLESDPQLANWVDKKTARIDTWQGLLESPQFENDIWSIVSAAIFAEQNLEIIYLGKNGEMRHEVCPLAAVKRDEVLYVALRFCGYEDVRLLPLHRIVRAAVLETSAAHDGEQLDLGSFLRNGLPFVLPGEQEFVIHLLLHESAYHSFKSRPLRGTLSISAPVDGWFEVKANEVRNTMELRWWLLGFGEKVRILEPEFLSRELQSLLFDSLTGLLARRACQEYLERMIAAAQRGGKPLAVAMVDIDYFKAINDDFGHSAGDRALQEISRRLKAACRSMDVVGRWGGEEFLILLPETTGKEAEVLAERLRQSVASTPCEMGDHGASRTVTVSIGLTSMSLPSQETLRPVGLLDGLLKEADRALYAAKIMRNRVEVYEA